jgi:hypothetical protein
VFFRVLVIVVINFLFSDYFVVSSSWVMYRFSFLSTLPSPFLLFSGMFP